MPGETPISKLFLVLPVVRVYLYLYDMLSNPTSALNFIEIYKKKNVT